MRWIKILGIVLGAIWFFPVSCTIGVIVGTHVIEKLDEREVVRDDEVHSLFTVVVEPGENGKPFRGVKLSELPYFKESTESISFLTSKPGGNIDFESSNISYKVIEESGPEQVIEVVKTYHDGDNTIWSCYRATQSTVSPISSRMFYFGYMFGAIPFAFGIASILYAIGRLLRKKASITKENY